MAAIYGCISTDSFHTGIMQISVRILIALLVAVAPVKTIAADAFSGGGDELVWAATDWMTQQTNFNPTEIQISAPNKRVAVQTCKTQLTFRFPFKNNIRTIEARCSNPSWKRFLRAKIQKIQKMVVARQLIEQGEPITELHIQLVERRNESSDFESVNEVIGLILNQSILTGTVLTADMISTEVSVFVPMRSYEAGEQIPLTELNLEQAINAEISTLIRWPNGIITAKMLIEAGKPLRKSDVEQSEYVVVSTKNIVRGQVVTANLLARKLQSVQSIGAKRLTAINQAIGLEATRTIRAGTILSQSDLTAADLVRKGESVTLTFKKGPLTITLDTLATANAKLDEQVILVNTESGEKIRGIVTGRHQAKGVSY